MSADALEVETVAEFGSDDASVATRWIAELDAAEKDSDFLKWQRRCKKIIKLYKEDRPDSTAKRRFALFWSNIKTLQPAIYANTPTAVVGRRWKDADPVGRMASEVLERALNYSVDAYAFDDVMKGVRDDDLLIARGIAWVRYIPTIQPAPTPDAANDEAAAPDMDGQVSDDAVQGEVVSWEEVRADHVSWEDFGTNPAREWAEVRFVWRRAFMTRDELVERFHDRGKVCPLDWAPKTGKDGDKDETFKKAAVYEIWDRSSKEAIWICKAFTSAPLDRKADPLGLEGFFPCPKPVFSTLAPDSIIPVPDYVYYQDQVEEIDELTGRIHLLIDALKVRGFYASDQKNDLNTLLRSETNTLIPVDSWAALAERGGVKGLIEWFPLDLIVTTLKGCFDSRKQIIDDVYQVTGISDVMRGDTDADETATAQGIKNTWGSSRVRDRQKELARFARDVMRLKSEVISNQFDPQTLSAMTDVQLLTVAELQQLQQVQQREQQVAQQAVQAAQAAGQPPPPPAPSRVTPQQQQMMQLPTWDDVMGLLRNKALRSFRIDIETDSTIEPNDQEEKSRRIEFVSAIGKYLAESLPVVQASPFMIPVIVEGLKFLVRGFRVGREMEDVIDRAMDQLQQGASQPQPQQPPKGPDPQAQQMTAKAALIKAQAAQQAVGVDQGHLQLEAQRAGLEHQQAMASVQAENLRTQVDERVGIHQANQQAATDQHQLMVQAVEKAEQRRLVGEINDTRPIQAPTR